MRYRAPLLDGSNNLSSEHWLLLTEAQLAKLANWSVLHDKTVMQILIDARFIIEDEGNGNTVRLEGTLPNCLMYGALLSDGSTHT